MNKPAKFSDTPKPDHAQIDSVIVRTAKFGGYWGRGATVAEAIKNATWIGSQDAVYVAHCDGAAHCDEVSGDLHTVVRGPLFKGTVTADKKDVRNITEHAPARLVAA